MTRDETKRILMVISATYPNFRPEELSFTINAWNEMLKEYSYEEAMRGLKTFISTDGGAFAPSVSQVIKNIHKVEEHGAYPNEMDAWAMVVKACSDAIYNSTKQFESLPTIVKKAVVTPNNLRQWGMIDSSEFNTVIYSNFIKNYRNVVESDKEMRRYPTEIRTLIEQTSKRMLLEG